MFFIDLLKSDLVMVRDQKQVEIQKSLKEFWI